MLTILRNGGGFFGRLKSEFFHGRDWSGVRAEGFAARLDGWLEFYRSGRLRAFREGGAGCTTR